MTRRNKIFILAAGGLIALAVVCFFCFREKEPSYDGRTLSEWTQRYCHFVGTPFGNEAENAIRVIGTNAIPTFLQWNNATDSTFEKSLMQIAEKLPTAMGRNFFGRRLADTSARRRHDWVFVGFTILGSNSLLAIPGLAAQFNSAGSEEQIGRAADALTWPCFGTTGVRELATITSTNTGERREVGINYLLRVTMSGHNETAKEAKNALTKIAPNARLRID